MYEFQKLENEEIIFISDNSLLKVDDQDKEISTIVTNQRLLLLDYPPKDNNYEEALKSRGASYIEKKQVILEVKISEIVSIEENDYDKYILSNTNYFYLKDKELKKYINK